MKHTISRAILPLLLIQEEQCEILAKELCNKYYSRTVWLGTDQSNITYSGHKALHKSNQKISHSLKRFLKSKTPWLKNSVWKEWSKLLIDI